MLESKGMEIGLGYSADWREGANYGKDVLYFNIIHMNTSPT